MSNTFGEFDVPQKQNMSFDWNLLKGVIFGIRTSEYDKKQILAKLISIRTNYQILLLSS